jgi:hypothetical protein
MPIRAFLLLLLLAACIPLPDLGTPPPPAGPPPALLPLDQVLSAPLPTASAASGAALAARGEALKVEAQAQP